jgi:EmrB/QacA subfamily drug resistance transporter
MATTLSVPNQTSDASGSRHPGLALLVIATAQLMVVLDATIVNVALPHIQTALQFSDSGLEWVVNGYALALGGLLLLGGRAGDLLGRRRMFIIGLLVFSAASLAGGLATSQAFLLAARAVQGAGGAIVTPTALALVFTTFAEGRPRHRALGVYSAMSVAGGAVGLLVGGLLVTYVSWRWVLFVNVPIGIVGALAARAVLPASARRPGRFDLPGIITGTGGVAALVYGLSNAATGQDGTSHWGDAKVIAALAGGAAALTAFGFIEARTKQALLPVRLLRSRNRVGANLMSLGVGTTLFGVFFFLTLFVQDVWGYSPLRAGAAFLPLTVAVLVTSVISTRLVARTGSRPLLLAGTVVASGGLYWMSRLAEHRGRARPAVRADVPGCPVRRGRERLGGGLQPAQRHPAGGRLHRPGRAGHRGLDRGRQPCPAGQDHGRLPARAGGRLRPGLPGRGGDHDRVAGRRRGPDPGPPVSLRRDRSPGRASGPAGHAGPAAPPRGRRPPC